MGDQPDNKRGILNKDDAASSSGTNDSKREDRRRALKSAMTAAGIAGVATWSKPVVESIVLPAHAETSPSEPVSMSGSLTDTNTLGRAPSTGGTGNLANAVLGSVVGTAHAAVGTPPDTSTNALVAFDHCISLEFPNGVAPGNTVNVSISGPDFDGQDIGGDADVNANGSGIGTLDGDLNFTASITSSNPNLTVEGCVDDDFGGAFGIVSADGDSTPSGTTSYYVGPGTAAGDGAFWEVSTGGSCSAYVFTSKVGP